MYMQTNKHSKQEQLYVNIKAKYNDIWLGMERECFRSSQMDGLCGVWVMQKQVSSHGVVTAVILNLPSFHQAPDKPAEEQI